MAYTLADLTELQSAIKQGVTSVRKGDREVRYRSLAEMRQVESAMKKELGLSGPSRVYPGYDNGL